MTKVIIIQGDSLESYYEQTLYYLHQKYHTYPSNLSNVSVDPEIAAEQSMYERLARDSADTPVNSNLPPGKIVY